MKTIRIFLSEKFHVLVVKFSVYLNRRVFVMYFGQKYRSPDHFLGNIRQILTELGPSQ